MAMDENDIRTDKEQATACFLENSGFVRLVAYDFAPSPDLLGDIVNDAFIYFVERADRWDYARDLKPLIRKITQNMARRHWEKHLRTLPTALGEIFEYLRCANESDAQRIESLEEEMIALDLCLRKLPPRYRNLIEAHYFGKTKLTEMAKAKNVKIGTLKKTMCRIRIALRECIEKTLGQGDRHGG